MSQSINLAVKNIDLLGLYFANISPIIGRILVIASILTGIYTIYLAWKSPKQVYNKIKGKLAVAFLLEALFFSVSLFFSVMFILRAFPFFGRSPSLYDVFSIFLFPLFMTPSLIMLTRELKNSQDVPSSGVFKWLGFASIGYVVATFAGNISKVDNFVLSNSNFSFMQGADYVFLFNEVFTFSLVFVFALLAVLPVIKTGSSNNSTLKFAFISVILYEVYYFISVSTSYPLEFLFQVFLSDMWLIPVVGLGIYVAFKKIEDEKKNDT